MIFFSSRHRGLTAVGVVALAAGCLVGCTPGPEPTPTPTSAFASEEEAFAAAEEVYRVYLEESDSADGDAEQYLAGPALEEYLDGVDYLRSNDLHLAGETVVAEFDGVSADIESDIATIETRACIDISASHVLNAQDENVTPADRGDHWTLTLTFKGDTESLILSSSVAEEVASCS